MENKIKKKKVSLPVHELVCSIIYLAKAENTGGATVLGAGNKQLSADTQAAPFAEDSAFTDI